MMQCVYVCVCRFWSDVLSSVGIGSGNNGSSCYRLDCIVWKTGWTLVLLFESKHFCQSMVSFCNFSWDQRESLFFSHSRRTPALFATPSLQDLYRDMPMRAWSNFEQTLSLSRSLSTCGTVERASQLRIAQWNLHRLSSGSALLGRFTEAVNFCDRADSPTEDANNAALSIGGR